MSARFLLRHLVFAAALVSAPLAVAAFGQQPSEDKSSGVPRSPELDPARKLLQQGKVDEAISALRAVDPATKGLALELGTAYYKKSDYLKAIAYLKKATEEDPSSKEAVQLLGMSYFANGHPADAIPLLEKVQGWIPRANVDGFYILGVCFIQTTNYDKARQAFAKTFDVPGDSAAAYLFTARMLLRQDYDPIAEEYAQKAIALDPQLPLAHFLLGELYLFKSRLPEAISEFRKELVINPAHAATYYKLADGYLRDQKFDEAQRLLQQSIRLDPTSSGPFILMGKVLQKKGEYDLAVLSLKRALNMDPNNPTTHYLLGQVYRDMGKKDDGAAEMKRAEELHVKEDLE